MELNEQELQTRGYVKKHRLNELFAHFLQLLIYNKPADPRLFLQQEIRSLLKGNPLTPLFTEQDFETMFDLIDVTKQRWVTVTQLRNTCRNLATAEGEEGLGIPPAQEEAIEKAADAEGRVTLEKFKEVLAMQLHTASVAKEN
ncbi:uncharacterized protein TEOVI_000636800 [Trypanosoma equiperdum]|uniref:EF-hand domain-containing protein n=4 Tax=Trypanozoon TaxID=39700 RepID=Q38B18_TRYB2|nr:hypothetical protein, conserved [Trypanosoma brucei gambiense DAL972]XP_822830.1 hypothetical protein, conserved [Trypanosoma brucei brucei TREU927]RHW69682.1 hypothetical protein DPX39_100064000 [Trypanosoma brucei equiperdum]SCU68400.1 hypothetical protein, conserved [Trypanosoma equiperdum]EAN78002.1 hypothetical protein, conserved [Trypanosoma brucei brucei TREU927]CBH15625.1 hypothetical protein, conserved [Trypanosoma brucei gambiense DAL972]|eukprot:XP_011777889.1 hypothetical protein, conserved [Trypanosoma brucei gambiense DAL972]